MRLNTPRKADTRQRILDAAERLFASRGYAGTSIRAIVAEADVNVAAIHYHFGSKDAVLRAVLDRIVKPVNAQRLDLLRAAETAAALTGQPAAVETILEAFVGPDLQLYAELGQRGVIITRFLGRSYTEPSELVQQLVREQFYELGEQFLAAFRRALPDVPVDELWFRLHCVIGVVTYLLATAGQAGALDPSQVPATVSRLVAFLAPGFRAPLQPTQGASS